MNDVRLIVEREFLTRVRSRGYVLATLAGLLAIVALNLAPSLLDELAPGDQQRLAVVDEAGAERRDEVTSFTQRLGAEFTETTGGGELRYAFELGVADRASAEELIGEGQVDGYLVLTDDGSAGAWPEEILVVTSDTLGSMDKSRLAAGFSAAATYVRLQSLGITAEQSQALFAPVRLEADVLGGGPATTEEQEAESWSLTYALVFLLYITLVIYGTYVAMGVVEEKSSRVVEILISTVRPMRLMLGKVLGIGAAALLQYAVWIGAGLAFFLARGSLSGERLGPLDLRFSDLDPLLLVAFGWFFVIGFFQYASLYAAGGAMVSRSEDANQVTGPLTMVLVVVFFFALYAMENPDAPLTAVLAQLPLTGPIVMFVRVALGEPAAWELVLSVLIGLGSIAGLLWAAARIYRAGILLYGRRMSLRALGQSLR